MSSRTRRVWALAAAAGIGFVVLARWPVTTRSGVNYRWSGQTIPLYEKAVNFISRDLQTRRIAQDIVRGIRGDDARLLAVFAWVQANVRPVPEGLPITDDHPLHIIIRGYGAADQRTEAFTLLASYAGYPAAMVTLVPFGAQDGLLAAWASAGSRRLVFDIVHGLAFRHPDGRLAAWDELVRDPALARAAAGGAEVNGVPYERYLRDDAVRLGAGFGRMAAQRPWMRFGQELSRVFRRPAEQPGHRHD